MKRTYNIFMILLVMGCLIVLNPGSEAKAKSSKVIHLDSDKEYKYDLNGDNKKETIEWTIKDSNNEDEVGDRVCILKINKKVQYTETLYGSQELYFGITDIYSKDKYKEINIENGGGIYRYSSGKLKRYCITSAVNGFNRQLDSSSGSGVLTYRVDCPYGDTSGTLDWYESKLQFKVSKGKLSLVKKSSYTVEKDGSTDHSAIKALTAYTTMGGKKKAFSLKKGENFDILNIHIKNGKVDYAYIKNKSGKKGWIKVLAYAY